MSFEKAEDPYVTYNDEYVVQEPEPAPKPVVREHVPLPVYEGEVTPAVPVERVVRDYVPEPVYEGKITPAAPVKHVVREYVPEPVYEGEVSPVAPAEVHVEKIVQPPQPVYSEDKVIDRVPVAEDPYVSYHREPGTTVVHEEPVYTPEPEPVVEVLPEPVVEVLPEPVVKVLPERTPDYTEYEPAPQSTKVYPAPEVET